MPFEVKRVLCAVDFSPCSMVALHHAAALAGWYGAELSTLHVHQRAAPIPTVPFVGGELSQPTLLSSVDRSRLTAALNDVVIRETGIARPDIHVQEADDIATAIVSHAGRWGTDLLVLGTHGRSGIERMMLGSVAERVLRRARGTTLTVPPQAVSVPVAPYSELLCAIDFSPGSARALDCARDLAVRFGGRLTALHIVELPPDVPDFPTADLTAYRAARFEHARQAMSAALAPVRDACEVKDILLAGRAGREIVGLATEQQSDVIVLGVHGRGAVDLAVFGSVTHHVVRHATCPVLTVRAEP